MNKKKQYCLFPKPHLNHLLFLFYFVSSIVKQYIFIGIKKEENLSIPIFKLYICYWRFTSSNTLSNNKEKNKV